MTIVPVDSTTNAMEAYAIHVANDTSWKNRICPAPNATKTFLKNAVHGAPSQTSAEPSGLAGASHCSQAQTSQEKRRSVRPGGRQ